MLIFLSGEEHLARPEVVFGDRAKVMLTYPMIRLKTNKANSRFRKIYKARKRKAKQ